MRTTSLGLILVLATIGCGGDDGQVTGDASFSDGPELDAQGFPAAPELGAPIDRMGRPAINTVLNSLLETDVMKKRAKRDAYNHAIEPADWLTTPLDSTAFPIPRVQTEFAAYIGALDALDTGHPDISPNGCGNAVGYSSTMMSAAYYPLAGILADDQLYIDSSRTQCDRYLAVELNAAVGAPTMSCGGRTLTNDVIDTSFSLLFAGAMGFTASLTPRIGDGVSAHADVMTTFPFLGAPH
ncbi:MAG: hypothetical protein JWP01_2269 [Myxococcales bacterium]|nr:hypothetical protein [Myxococcales bacterium]